MPSAIVYRHVRSFIALLTFAGSLLLATSAIAAHPLPATPSGAVAPPGPPPPVLGACAAPRWLVGRVEATSATSLTSFTSLTAPTTPPTFMASRPVAGGLQVTVPRGTDSTVEVRPLGADTIELVARWNALLLRQTVRRDGRMTLELRVGRQRTLVVVTPDSVQVSGNRQSLRFDPRRASEEDYARVQQLLAKATPMRLFRRYRARLEASGDEGAAVVGLLTSSAYLGLLDGDVGAPGRIARRLAQAHKARVRPASFGPNCFLDYEREVYGVWVDLEQCYFSTSPLYHRMCEARWVLWVESSWFSFLSCSWGF